VKYCNSCLYPDTKPQLVFNNDGICSACINNQKKETIDWRKKRKEFSEILEKYRSKNNNNYDCIIPVSGGKDSTYQTYVMKEEFGLNPLVVNFHPLDQTEIGRKNLESLKKIGVDCIEFSPNPIIYKKLAKFGLTELGDFQWPEHVGIFTIPVQIAVQYKIPLIVWGENPQLEYGQPTDVDRDTLLDKKWTEKNGGYFLDQIKPQDMTKYGFSLKDLKPYLYPSENEINEVGVTGIFLGTYIKWDIFKQLEFVKTLGFSENVEIKEGTYDKWENIDVFFTVFHDYFKFLKYGFGRTTDHVSIEIRYGRMSREEGINLIKKYEGKIPRKYFKEFLESAEMTEDEFHEICDKFTDKELFMTDEDGNLVKDDNGNLTLKNKIL
jgi:N-acetyl sugar amidotransferase